MQPYSYTYSTSESDIALADTPDTPAPIGLPLPPELAYREPCLVSRLLTELDGDSPEGVVARLTGRELRALTRDFNRRCQMTGAGALKAADRDRLFAALAGGLDGKQLGRMANGFENQEDVFMLSVAIADFGTPTTMAEFVQALTEGPELVDEWFLDLDLGSKSKKPGAGETLASVVKASTSKTVWEVRYRG